VQPGIGSEIRQPFSYAIVGGLLVSHSAIQPTPVAARIARGEKITFAID
jgi:hypothetical protein